MAALRGPFRFGALPYEMQTRVAELIDMETFKALSCTNKQTRANVVRELKPWK